MKRIYALLIIMPVSLAFQLMPQWPWWTYLIACFITGFFLPFKKWHASAFASGCISGCAIWVGATLFFNSHYPGKLLDTVALLLLVPYPALLLIIGIIGAILSGLSVYAGFLLRRGQVETRLNLAKM